MPSTIRKLFYINRFVLQGFSGEPESIQRKKRERSRLAGIPLTGNKGK